MKAGFSLIEIIIAIALTGILGVALFNAFFQTSKTLNTIERYNDLDTRFVVVLHQLEHDMAGTFIPVLPSSYSAKATKDKSAAPKTDLEKTDLKKEEVKKEEQPKLLEKIFFAQTKNNNLSLLTFITNNPFSHYVAPQPQVSPKPLLVRIVYRLKEDKTRKGTFILTRQESTDLNFSSFESSDKKKPREIVVADAIKKCTLTYRVSKKGEKEEKPEIISEWNSDAAAKADDKKETKPLLPESVNVALTLVSENETERSFNYAIPLYCFEMAQPQETEAQPPADKGESGKAKGAQEPAAQPSKPARPNVFSRLMDSATRTASARRKPSFMQRFRGTKI